MDAAAAIDELRSLSTQIDVILVASRDGAVTASTVDSARADRLGRLARDLVAGADPVRAPRGAPPRRPRPGRGGGAAAGGGGPGAPPPPPPPGAPRGGGGLLWAR